MSVWIEVCVCVFDVWIQLKPPATSITRPVLGKLSIWIENDEYLGNWKQCLNCLDKLIRIEKKYLLWLTPRRTMQIAPNDEAEYTGGGLVFATSAGFEVPHRPVGTACIHNFDIVHGVTAMVTGTRYR